MHAASRTRSARRGDAIVHQILTAVAETEQCDVLDLPPLSAVIDPDALGQLVHGGDTEIAFSYHGSHVTIDGDGHVDVMPQQE